MSQKAPSEADSTRRRICDEAEQLFRRMGYAKTTVADIAAALGMSSANVYRFFSSKSDINNAICRRILSAVRDELDTASRDGPDAALQIEAMVVAMHRHHKAQLTHEKRVFDMVMAAMDENWAAVEEHIHICESRFADVIARGVEAGEFPAQNAAASAEMVMKSCVFAIHPILIAECGNDDMEPMVRRLARFAVAALRSGSQEPDR